ncbi:hypothetical protein OROHE_023568 [Orobanche hederae]
MLFAVEGGRFFSSSASGYSKCLTLLLLGQKNEENPMRVTPWKQYQLVDRDTGLDIQLASGKNQPTRGCASFVCFGCTAAGLESPSSLKVGPHLNQEVLPGPPPVLDDSTNLKNLAGGVVDGGGNDDDDDSKRNVVTLKSSLRKDINGREKNEDETLCEQSNGVACQREKKVQWTDTSGGELFEIREFEMSEDGSDGDFDHASGKTCSCSIM